MRNLGRAVPTTPGAGGNAPAGLRPAGPDASK